MSEDYKHPSNDEPVKRRPGRPKGLPRPEGAGRKKGTPNRVTRELREAAGKYTLKALKVLAAQLDHPDPKVVQGAARELLDRSHGKPVTPSEITGRDGAPLMLADTDTREGQIDIGRRILYALHQSAHAGDEVVGAVIAAYRPAAPPLPPVHEASRPSEPAIAPVAEVKRVRIGPGELDFLTVSAEADEAEIQRSAHLTQYTDAAVEAARRPAVMVRTCR